MSGSAPQASVDVLLVEDDPRDAELTVETLNSADAGWSIVVQPDVISGLAYLDAHRETPPRLVLVDLKLIGAHGTEMVAAIRSDADLADLLVVALSGSRDVRSVVDASRAGVTGYVMKPITIPKLLEALGDRAAQLHTQNTPVAARP